MSSRLWVGLSLVVVGFANPLRAQTDYRNLDESGSLGLEDALPIEHYGFQWTLPYRIQTTVHGRRHATEPELDYGLVANGMVGIAFPFALLEGGGPPSVGGFAGVRLFALYNVLGETSGLPAAALRLDGVLPVGALAPKAGVITLKAIVTRSFGERRAHLNFARTWGGGVTNARVADESRWWAGAGVDQTFFRSSTLVLAEFRLEQPVENADLEYGIALGARRQVSPSLVLAFGAAHRFAGRTSSFFLAISRMFGVRGLLP